MRGSKPSRSRANSLHYDNVDLQILLLHQAMAKKLIAHPHLRTTVIETIEQRYASGQLRHGGYLIWSCLMEDIDDHQAFLLGVLAQTPQMQKLRRRTPFVGILSEEERRIALVEEGIES